MIRLFVQADLAEGARVPLGPDQAHYLLHVMRLGPGDAVELFNGRDGAWRAGLAEASKRGAMLNVEARTREQTLSPDLELVVALVKRARLETIMEKAAELGVRRIRLAVTRRTNAERANVDRLTAIATEAAEQCERLEVPEVVAPEKLERILDAWGETRRLMFCDESGTGWEYDEDRSPPAGGSGREADEGGSRSTAGADAPPPPFGRSPSPRGGESGVVPPALDALRFHSPGPWAVLIGPEGGFDPAEQARLRALPFVVPVALGPRILRADTAAIAALTLWQAALGDWQAAGGGA
jgi:16S rRNA (uracil1498-N3)-methyltransferase